MDSLASPVAVITVQGGVLTIAPSGIHRLSSLVRSVIVPLEAVDCIREISPERRVEILEPRLTKRKKGSQIGDRYRAGSFQYWKSDDWWWFLLRKDDPAVELSLIGHRYDHIVVAVADPAQVIRTVEAARTTMEVS